MKKELKDIVLEAIEKEGLMEDFHAELVEDGGHYDALKREGKEQFGGYFTFKSSLKGEDFWQAADGKIVEAIEGEL